MQCGFRRERYQPTAQTFAWSANICSRSGCYCSMVRTRVVSDNHVVFLKLLVYICDSSVLSIYKKLVHLNLAHLKSLILLCKNFLIFQGRSLCPSISGVSCSSRSASLSLSCKGAPGGARSASGPATHAVPATSTKIATQHQRRCHTDKPELWLGSHNKENCIFKHDSH